MSSAFNPVSPQELAISHLFMAILIIMAAIFLLVTGLLLYIVVRYRARRNDAEPPQIFGNTRLELAWTIAPALLLVGVFGFTLHGSYVADPLGNGQTTSIVVVGHQWWWQIEYPAAGVVTANEIHLPVGRKMLLRLRSADVIHNLWFPQLGPKMDLVPGQTNFIWLEADKPGVYLGACAEFCGTEHAWMRLRAIAQPPAEYAAWLRAQALPAMTQRGSLAMQGAQVFAQRTCISCHAISGTGATSAVGPNLTHLGSRQTLAAGVLTNTAANLAAWLRQPQVIKPGAQMPNVQLSEPEVRALTAYLEGLQ